MTDKIVIPEFNVCHKIVDEYRFFHHKADIRTITHCISNENFVIWINYNDDLDDEKEACIFKKITRDLKLENFGWFVKPLVEKCKAPPYELYNNFLTVIFSVNQTYLDQ